MKHQDLNAMSNNMSDVRRKRRDENLPKKTRIRHGSSETLSVKETMKPEAMPELMQVTMIVLYLLNQLWLSVR